MSLSNSHLPVLSLKLGRILQSGCDCADLVIDADVSNG